MSNNNPCEGCGYHWYDEELGYETCHYPENEPHQWAPCEANEESERIAREEEEWEHFKRQIEEEYRDED